MLRSRRLSRGVSLIEMAIVIAIIGIAAALAGPSLTRSLPMWRTKRAAKEFAAALNTCKQMSIAQDREYRVRLSLFDSDPSGSGDNVGLYYIEAGNLAQDSTTWDILPIDDGGIDTTTGEGTVEISQGGEDQLTDVSIEDWGTSAGDIVCSPRGWLTNPNTDFDARGYIGVTFLNKEAAQRGVTDQWTVVVSRGGLVRLEPTVGTPVGFDNGIAGVSSTDGSGSGHVP